MDFFQIRVSNHGRIRAKKDTRAKERAVNAITDELVYTACCRLVNYYNCEVPTIFRLALVHQRYTPIPTCRHCPAILNSIDPYDTLPQYRRIKSDRSNLTHCTYVNFIKLNKYIKKIMCLSI